MKDTAILKAVEKSGKKIHQLSKKIRKNFDDDDIHDFRVEVKKLRALLRLLAFQSRKHQPDITKKIKSFYSYIGMVRNHRLQRQYTGNFITEHQLAVPDTYMQMLDVEEAYWKTQALQLMDGTNFLNDIAKIKKELPGKLTQPAIDQFVKAKLKDLSKYKTGLPADDALHSIRKVFKDFQYNWHFIKKDAHLPANFSNIEEIKTFTELIGAFMDTEVQASSLQLFDESTVKDADELKTLQQLTATCQQKKTTLKQQVIAAIQLLPIPAKKQKHKKVKDSLVMAED